LDIKNASPELITDILASDLKRNQNLITKSILAIRAKLAKIGNPISPYKASWPSRNSIEKEAPKIHLRIITKKILETIRMDSAISRFLFPELIMAQLHFAQIGEDMFRSRVLPNAR
jgi:hypothetical protein